MIGRSVGVDTVLTLAALSSSSLPSAAPGAPPQNVETRHTSESSLLVTWEAPPVGQRNGEILGYKVMYSRERDAEEGDAIIKAINIDNPTQRSVTIDNLETYTRYRVRVSAYTSRGEGPASPTEVVRTDEDGKTATHSSSPCALNILNHSFFVSNLPTLSSITSQTSVVALKFFPLFSCVSALMCTPQILLQFFSEAVANHCYKFSSTILV